VQLAGVYDHEHEVYIGMRGKPGSKAEEERGAGYSVVTPLDIGGGGGSEVSAYQCCAA
jgi:cytochrome oxidase assembly protein ShyY1